MNKATAKLQQTDYLSEHLIRLIEDITADKEVINESKLMSQYATLRRS